MEKKHKIDFYNGAHLGFLSSGEEAQIVFQDGGHGGHLVFPIGMF